MPRSHPFPQRKCLPILPALMRSLLLVLLSAPACRALTPTPAATDAFNAYTAALELQLAARHRSPVHFLALIDTPPAAARLRSGELLLEDLSPLISPQHPPVGPGALLHNWRGTVFVPNAHAAAFTALLRSTTAYPAIFAPQILRAATLNGSGDHLQILLRVVQHHGLTVTLDTAYDTTFTQLDSQHAFSTSRSTAINEIASAGTPREHPLTPAEAHGFLWRQNTYWSYEERDGGLYLQLESVSLTRSVPTGLGWIAGPYLASIPRESLAFTLRSACNALRREEPKNQGSEAVLIGR